MSSGADALIAAVRERFGTLELHFRAEGSILMVEVVDRTGVTRIGSGGTVAGALQSLLDGRCGRA